MKIYFRLTLLAIGLLFAGSADAQVGFGIKGGLNVTDMSISNDVFDKSNRAGWFFGPTIKISIPLAGLGVDASALYDQRSAKVTSSSEKETIKQQQIAIPVNLRYTVGLGSLANVIFFAGPQWGINVGDDDFKWNDGSSYSLKKSNFSINIGLGATVLKHVQVTANYNIACGKSANLTLKQAGKNYDSHNNAWQLGLAYFF
nr:porin family protein [Prevotella sp.]